MHGRVTFLPAAMLAMFNSYGQQPPIRYTFKEIASTDVPAKGTIIEGATLGDSGVVAFIVRWTEGNAEHTALFTSSGMIARDGSHIQGRVLKRIIPTCLTVSRNGVVGYEATAGAANQTAVFIGNKLGAVLSQGGEPNDFTLSDDGELILLNAKQAAFDQTQMVSDANRAASLKRMPGSIYDDITRRMPGLHLPSSSTIIGPPSPEKRATQGRPGPPDHPCKSPEWPYPYSWNIGDTVSGPIATHISEGPAKRAYTSRFFGDVAAPFREIQCSAAGAPLDRRYR